MNAKDIMTQPVIHVGPDTKVNEIATLLLESCVSAVPVVDENENMLGIVSEGDLVAHAQAGTNLPNKRSWWLSILSDPRTRAEDYIKQHGRTANEVMTKKVITVEEEATLPEIAKLLEQHGIKRVPVVRDKKVVGIISRANLLQGLAHPDSVPKEYAKGTKLRDEIAQEVQNAGFQTIGLNVVVSDSSVQLWGAAESQEECHAIGVIAKNAVEGQNVENNLRVLSAQMVV